MGAMGAVGVGASGAGEEGLERVAWGPRGRPGMAGVACSTPAGHPGAGSPLGDK